jgi:hypothetical protein
LEPFLKAVTKGFYNFIEKSMLIEIFKYLNPTKITFEEIFLNLTANKINKRYTKNNLNLVVI